MLPLDHTFHHNGQTVVWGSIGEGDPIVLIHGFPWSAQAWRTIAPWLARRRTVYYFDMIGCGQSEKFDGQDVSPAVQGGLLAALFEHWGLERPEVLAHDFGGLAALRGYFLHGLRYGRLILMDAVAVLPSGSPFFAHVRDHEAAFAGMPAYAHEALFRAYIQQAAARPLHEEAFQTYAAPWRGEAGQAAFYRQIAQSDIRCVEELVPRYGATACPVDVVWGERDTFIPVAQGEQLAGLLNARSFTRVPGAGHIVQEDAPEAVVAAVLG
jgi:pimeloyl-ACP methyl ester carboxylesterase